jgi:hypothetical protein
MSSAPFPVEIIGPFGDQDMHILVGRDLLDVEFLIGDSVGCWGAGIFRSGFFERMLARSWLCPSLDYTVMGSTPFAAAIGRGANG